jgi:hypothetical protein
LTDGWITDVAEPMILRRRALAGNQLPEMTLMFTDRNGRQRIDRIRGVIRGVFAMAINAERAQLAERRW